MRYRYSSKSIILFAWIWSCFKAGKAHKQAELLLIFHTNFIFPTSDEDDRGCIFLSLTSFLSHNDKLQRVSTCQIPCIFRNLSPFNYPFSHQRVISFWPGACIQVINKGNSKQHFLLNRLMKSGLKLSTHKIHPIFECFCFDFKTWFEIPLVYNAIANHAFLRRRK